MATAPARWAEVDLPYGLWRNGKVTRRVRLRDLTGFDEIDLAEALREGETPLAVGNRLVATCTADDEGPLAGQARSLALGDREVLLRALYAQTLSRHLAATVACPACQAAILFDLDLATLVQMPPEPGPEHEIDLGSGRLTVHLVTAEDLETAVERPGDPAVELTSALGGSMAQREALASALARLDPNAECAIALTCAECEAETVAYLDGFDLLRRGLLEGGGIFAQVDLLARTYGWSEADILVMPRARRLRYVAMASA